MIRSIQYRMFRIRPHRFVKTRRFAEIIDPNGEYWDETGVYETTKLAIIEAMDMIDRYWSEERR